MVTENLTETIKRELPALLRSDPALRRFILDITRESYADRDQTEHRFEQMLNELRTDREEQNRKWEEQKLERERDREEQARKWDEQKLERDRDREEQARKWDEQNRKWDEAREEFRLVHEEIMAQAKKFDRSIGALGSRWGLQSEAAFRIALAGILEQSFGVEVLNINEYDEQGEVFGRPDQIELDIIIKNGLLLICELKSSIDKAGMYIFERKVRFYEKRHRRKADRMIVVSPMIEPRAEKVAQKLGVETYGDSSEVEE
jgi:hypothetical protein